ncbi:ferric reductase-like transmembrane domain-containing protein [Ancylobacter sp. Lp-2]|uniref:sulfite oxidase heme-binding subunit YedZ n=1 Tax=Ancylobacter sp. Lp-2 TaxID=2881339 RepID=UPI001E5CE742|nr:ferric reductase-like transmembrane domain-containing protein [Ancylobacter sp. Lp-2]MCB4770886.1 ferric reductase-like transmembrane domain-containing protein [Ancylobacter sp. Lp-2]
MPFLRERSGAKGSPYRWSPEKIAALLFVLLPFALLAARILRGDLAATDPLGLGAPGLGGPGLNAGLGPGAAGGLGGGAAGGLGGGPALGARPLVETLRFLGDWAVRLLLITLAVTPARRLFNWPKLLNARRTLGLGAAALVAVHFGLYCIDMGSFSVVVREIVLRIYLTIGFVALLGLLALSSTSWDGAVARLGAERWRRLHLLAYPITALAILHFFMQQKLDVTEPTLMAGFFLWLMGWRVLQRYGHGTGLLALVLLAVSAGLATALLEAGWYLAATGIDPKRVLAANLAFSYSIRPAWWVAGLGIAVALASEAALRIRPLPARRARASSAVT